MKRHALLIVIAACLLLALGCAALFTGRAQGPAPARSTQAQIRVNLAIPAQLAAGAVQVGLAQGLFEQHGVALATQTFKTGKQGLEAVLAGRADLAVVGDTPFVLAALRGEDIGIVSTVFSSRKGMALLGLRERGIVRGADLAGKKIGTMRGTNAQFFLDALLLAHGLDRHGVSVVELTAEALPEALRAGQVDAVTLWQPDLALLQAELGAGAVALYGDDLFVFRFLLVGRRQYIDTHVEALTRLMGALADATDLIHDRPDLGAAVIGRSLRLSGGALAAAFDVSDYRLTLDQSLLLALSSQTRWAFRHGLVRDGLTEPDYLLMLHQAPLRAARPDAIRVIQ